MKRIWLTAVAALVWWNFASIPDLKDKPLNLGLIPLPQQVEVRDGSYQFSHETTYSIKSSTPELEYVVAYFSDHLKKRYGINVKKADNEAAVRLNISNEMDSPEGYRLETSSSGVSITASNAPGVFYGVVTLIQLFLRR